MLNFPLELTSTLFDDAIELNSLANTCAKILVPKETAKEIMRTSFPHLSDIEYYELRYEISEMLCIKLRKHRVKGWDVRHNPKLKCILFARSDENNGSLSVRTLSKGKFTQFLGRGIRKWGEDHGSV